MGAVDGRNLRCHRHLFGQFSCLFYWANAGAIGGAGVARQSDLPLEPSRRNLSGLAGVCDALTAVYAL